jgi:hypothetical protein
MLLICSKWRYGSSREGYDFSCFLREICEAGQGHPERQFPKDPGPQRGAITPMGADQKHSRLFRSIRVKPSVLDAWC